MSRQLVSFIIIYYVIDDENCKFLTLPGRSECGVQLAWGFPPRSKWTYREVFHPAVVPQPPFNQFFFTQDQQLNYFISHFLYCPIKQSCNCPFVVNDCWKNSVESQRSQCLFKVFNNIYQGTSWIRRFRKQINSSQHL